MTNADKFKQIFGLYATELWSKTEGEFLAWLNSDFSQSDVPDMNVGDMVSRQAAIKAINTWDKFGVDERGRLVRWHEGLEPYVHLRDVLTAIVNLPSAEPERKKGTWLMNGEIYGHMYWRCSQCGEEVDYIGANFCPNCGSFNGGEEDG